MKLQVEPSRPRQGKARKKPNKKIREKWTKSDWINKAVWPIFSKYIRLRDCLETTGSQTHGKCITCGKTYPFGKLQAGHFLPGRTDTILFDEELVYAQCYRCNVMLAGLWPRYYRAMQEYHGQDWVEYKIDAWQEDREELTIPKLKALESLFKMEFNNLLER